MQARQVAVKLLAQDLFPLQEARFSRTSSTSRACASIAER